MKKFTHFICMVLVASMFFAFPVHAQAAVEPRGSAYFDCYGAALAKVSASSFQIWFDVDSNLITMDELGVSEIVVYRSSDQQYWTQMKTYKPDNYPQMLDYNTGSHAGYVTYDFATSGYYYTACITFYAKNSTGIGEREIYTEIIRM